MGCLYQLTSPSGKSYIGITTKTAEERFSKHVLASKHRNNGAIYNAIRKYGAEAFEVKTLVIARDWEYLCDLERKAIKSFGTKSPNGYNVTNGGEGVVGYDRDAEDLLAISIAQKKRYENPEQRKILVAQAKAANDAMRAAHAARRINGMTPAQLKAFESRSRMESRERSHKISEAAKAAWADPEKKERLLAGAIRRVTPEFREKISVALTGRKNAPASENRKQKIRDKQIASWSDPETKAARVVGMLAAARLKSPGMDVICKICQKEFHLAPWQIRTRPTEVCSRACWKESKRKDKC